MLEDYSYACVANSTVYVEVLPNTYTSKAVVKGVTKEITQDVRSNSTVS